MLARAPCPPGRPDGCPQHAYLFLGDHDGVEPAVAQGEAEPAKLSDGVANALKQVPLALHQVPGAVFTAPLFVANQRQDDVPRQGKGFRFRPQKGGQHHRDAAFHVQGAPAPDVAIHYPSLKRRVPPFSRVCRHHVHMSLEQQGRRIAPARKLGDQVGPVRRATDELGVATGVRQQPVNVGEALPLVPGWVGGVETNEGLQQFCYPVGPAGESDRRRGWHS